MIIGKISKGTKMDQIYLSKNRSGLKVGSYVIIEKVEKSNDIYYHNIDYIEPIKVEIINKIFNFADEENIFIVGSFLEKGFNFNDMDIVVVGRIGGIGEFIKSNFGIKAHIMNLSYKEIQIGINTDPLFQSMFSKFIAKKRFSFDINNRINYKLMDLSLLKSPLLITNYEISSGNEKYKLLRNLFAIKMFIEHKNLTLASVNNEIEKYFYKGFLKDFQNNLVFLKDFQKKYERLYELLFDKIMNEIKKQEKA